MKKISLWVFGLCLCCIGSTPLEAQNQPQTCTINSYNPILCPPGTQCLLDPVSDEEFGLCCPMSSHASCGGVCCPPDHPCCDQIAGQCSKTGCDNNYKRSHEKQKHNTKRTPPKPPLKKQGLKGIFKLYPCLKECMLNFNEVDPQFALLARGT